jgi:hypothetical protein
MLASDCCCRACLALYDGRREVLTTSRVYVPYLEACQLIEHGPREQESDIEADTEIGQEHRRARETRARDRDRYKDR